MADVDCIQPEFTHPAVSAVLEVACGIRAPELDSSPGLVRAMQHLRVRLARGNLVRTRALPRQYLNRTSHR
jgi:hypothetical protein